MIRLTLLALALVAVATSTPGACAQTPLTGDDGALWRALGVSRPAVAGDAPAFALKDLAGQVTRLDQLRGHVVMAYFWTTW